MRSVGRSSPERSDQPVCGDPLIAPTVNAVLPSVMLSVLPRAAKLFARCRLVPNVTLPRESAVLAERRPIE